ncbi:transcription termination/antitermination NusG family protein [Phyllobacterium sp. YR531]|uniref:transcription termination/antitermination protein NusG n=1 Tax=Phyllobacterium sp. YR531 TaxID=1144343 RepID=UPI00026FBADF|nr:transcription termination/antitermination NusG family protein [Phyllobacterium sp. YR531]EJN04259.1 transcription antiterminator [Phyllobacterium sp. YR531]
MKAGIDKDKHWYVVRTIVKGEGKAFEHIRKAGYDVYFPRRRVEVQHRRTKAYFVKEQPLMPRYLFVGQPKVNPDFYRLRNCDGVEGILGVNGQPTRVSEKSVENIYLSEIEMDFDDTRAARIHRKEETVSVKQNTRRQFPVGMSVFVTGEGSPFASFGGVVDEVTQSGKVRTLLELFGRMTSVEFDPQQLTIASRSAA